MFENYFIRKRWKLFIIPLSLQLIRDSATMEKMRIILVNIILRCTHHANKCGAVTILPWSKKSKWIRISHIFEKFTFTLTHTLFLTLISCATLVVPPGYKNIPDLSKRFPDCCVKLVKIDDDKKDKSWRKEI